MNIVYEQMKSLIPYKTCRKERENGAFQIVANENGEIVYLNETSKEFYSLCNGAHTIEELYLVLLDIYDVGEEELQHDLVSLVRDMQWNQILTMKEVVP